MAVLLSRRAGHLSDRHAVQLVDRPYAGQDLSGGDVWASNCQWRCKLSPSAYAVYIPDSFSGQLQIIVNQSESWPAEVQSD